MKILDTRRVTLVVALTLGAIVGALDAMSFENSIMEARIGVFLGAALVSSAFFAVVTAILCKIWNTIAKNANKQAAQ